MKEIDFRPDRYRVRRTRKRNVVIRVTFLGVLAVVLILGSVGAYARKAIARQEMAGLQGDLESQAKVFKGIDAMLVHLDDVRDKRQLLSDVAGGAPLYRVLAELAHAMPDATALTKVHVAQKRKIGDTGDLPGGVDATWIDGMSKLEVTGWTDLDVNVGRFMARMSESALFRNVRLGYSNPVVVEGREVREFKLTCLFPEFE